MAVHRIDDNAELILQRLARAYGKRPAAWLSDLIRDYAAGLEFPPEKCDDKSGVLILADRPTGR